MINTRQGPEMLESRFNVSSRSYRQNVLIGDVLLTSCLSEDEQLELNPYTQLMYKLLWHFINPWKKDINEISLYLLYAFLFYEGRRD